MDSVNKSLAKYQPTTLIAGTVGVLLALYAGAKAYTDPKGLPTQCHRPLTIRYQASHLENIL